MRVPFGASSVVGIVTALESQSSHTLKPIIEVIDAKPLLTPDLIELANWLSVYYHHPLGEVYATILPVAARKGRPARRTPVSVWRTLDGDLDSLRRAPRQLEVWQRLDRAGPIMDEEARELGATPQILRALTAKQLVEATVQQPRYALVPSQLDLSDEQSAAVEAIVGSLATFAIHLIDGVTGSGKTEVYLRAIEAVLDRGQQALMLVPEIALTPQTIQRVRDRFGAAAAIHSATADGQRFDTWIGAACGEHRILIGTRSALFTPFADLGLVIVDEEHDTSFKQTEGLKYSARDVAIMRARELQIPCVLGSATPSLESIVNARRGRFRVSRLSHRPGAARLPSFRIVDVRGHRLEGGLSQPVLKVIEDHLQAQGQVLVFINRRGYAPSLFCTECGWQAHCDDCDVRLTLHQHPTELRCHHCDRRYGIPTTCLQCGDGQLIALGSGTQRTEETLRQAFPDVPVYRVDRDSTRTQSKLEQLLASLAQTPRSILIGTQMLAKGHHLPNVTLVAVLDADNGFLSSDFRAPERTAQLIVQVAGRAGRAERPGEVWVQTYDPGNANLKALVEHGYEGFADTEIQHRQAAALPPFSAMAIIRADATQPDAPESFVAHLLDIARSSGIEAIGPVPAPIARKVGRFRFQGMLLSSDRRRLHAALRAVAQATPPQRMRWSIDVDPADTY